MSQTVKVEGLVLRSVKYSETSLIFDIYTEEYGLLSCIANGARKAYSRLPASLFQVMNLLELVIYYKESSMLHRVKEGRLAYVYQQLQIHRHRSGIALFMTEVVQKTIREHESNSGLYRFLKESYLRLDQERETIYHFHLYFLIQLASYLGFKPQGMWTVNTPYFNLSAGTFGSIRHPVHSLDQKSSEWIFILLNQSVDTVSGLKIAHSERRVLLQDLLLFYEFHIEKLKEIRTHKILASVFE